MKKLFIIMMLLCFSIPAYSGTSISVSGGYGVTGERIGDTTSVSDGGILPSLGFGWSDGNTEWSLSFPIGDITRQIYKADGVILGMSATWRYYAGQDFLQPFIGLGFGVKGGGTTSTAILAGTYELQLGMAFNFGQGSFGIYMPFTGSAGIFSTSYSTNFYTDNGLGALGEMSINF